MIQLTIKSFLKNKQTKRLFSSNYKNYVHPLEILFCLNTLQNMLKYKENNLCVIDNNEKVLNFMQMFSTNYNLEFHCCKIINNNIPFTKDIVNDYYNTIKTSIKSDIIYMQKFKQHFKKILSNEDIGFVFEVDKFNNNWYFLEEEIYKKINAKCEFLENISQDQKLLKNKINNNVFDRYKTSLINNFPNIPFDANKHRLCSNNNIIKNNEHNKKLLQHCYSELYHIQNFNIFWYDLDEKKLNSSLAKYSFVENIIYPNDDIVKKYKHLFKNINLSVEKHRPKFAIICNPEIKFGNYRNYFKEFILCNTRLFAKIVFLKSLKRV